MLEHLPAGMIARIAFLLAGVTLAGGCGKAEIRNAALRESPSELVVFHAGSLSVPFRRLGEEFIKAHPGVQIKAEAAGSRDTARKVSDLQRPCDVLASADHKVVENLLMPKHVAFNIRFATNEMAIAFTGKSKYATEVTGENWHEILMKDDVIFGRADPNRDPCGYRTVMVFQLAEKYFREAGLATRLEAKAGRRHIRPKETDLLALLEAGELDYIFIYRSVARQHKLSFIPLPDELNLKSPAHAGLYATAAVKVTGKRPGQMITRRGAPIVYSVTIPKNAVNRELALEYVELLLSPQGQKIVAGCGQMPIVPALTSEYEEVPETLKKYCKKAQKSK